MWGTKLRLRIRGTVPVLYRMSAWHAQGKIMFYFYIDRGKFDKFVSLCKSEVQDTRCNPRTLFCGRQS